MNLKQYGLIAALCSTLTLLPARTPMHVTFDLGGVCIDTDGFAAAREVGLGSFARFGIHNVSKILVLGDHIRYQVLFKFLHTINRPETTYSVDPRGHQIPQIMCDWLRGTITQDALLKTINDHLARARLSAAEKNLIAETTAMMFTPTRFIKTQVLIPQAYDLVEYCVKSGDVVSVHSVWDPVSFVLLIQKYPDFFALFDPAHIFISGTMGLLKPDPASYRYVLERLGLTDEPWRNCFVDDLKVNTDAAAAVGIYAIQYVKTPGSLLSRSHHNFDAVKKQLHARRLELMQRDFDAFIHEQRITIKTNTSDRAYYVPQHVA